MKKTCRTTRLLALTHGIEVCKLREVSNLDMHFESVGHPGLSPKTGKTELDSLKTKLQEAVTDASSGIQSILSEAWMLGPRQTGPNLLLKSPSSAEGLFNVPNNEVESLTKKPGKTVTD